MKDNSLQWNWRGYFTKANLEYGRIDASLGKMDKFECDPAGSWARCVTSGGFTVQVLKAPTTYEELIHYPSWKTLLTSADTNSPYSCRRYYSCTCSQGSMGQRCRHLASLMYKWEEVHGPFILTENEAERAARIKAEQERLEEERRKKRLFEEMQAKKNNTFSAADYLLARVSKPPAGLFFRPNTILRKTELLTNQYETEQLVELTQMDPDLQVRSLFSLGQKQMLEATGRYGEDEVEIIISQDRIEKLVCQCGRSHLRFYAYWSSNDRQGRMCSHAMALWLALYEYIVRENPGDETDYEGLQFLSLMTSGSTLQDQQTAIVSEPVVKKRACVALVPRITRDNNQSGLKLNFDIGHAGERCYAVKGLEHLVHTVEEEKLYTPSKSTSIDFSQETFTDDAAGWYQLIQSRVRSVKSVNAKLSRMPADTQEKVQSALTRMLNEGEGGMICILL